MALISMTRLRLRSLRYVPELLWHIYASARQARRAPGFLGGTLAGEKIRGFWTITAWEDEAAMRAFRGADAHHRVMPKLLNWCDEASVAHWEQDSATLPDMEEALRRMVADGRLSKVNHPSPDHAAGIIAAKRRVPRMSLQLRPVASTRPRPQVTASEAERHRADR
jgi:hypothetical protein